MKAITFNEYGPADVLTMSEVDMPVPGPGQVIVKIQAAGINPGDWRIRSGQFRRAFRIRMPFIPGSDIAGSVVATAENAKRFQPGDRIYAMLPLKTGGGYAQFAAVDEMGAALAPKTAAWENSGAMPLAGLTALQGLQKHGDVRPGHTVLINGGSGGVGHFAVQIAAALGAEVHAITSTPNLEWVRSLGAQQVLDYKTQDVFAGLPRFDVVFDTIATQSFRCWSKVLKPGGALVTVNPVIGRVIPGFLTKMFGVSKLRSFFVKPDADDLARLSSLFDVGQVRPRLQQIFDLQEAADAQRLSEQGRVAGKLVLRVDNH